MYRYAKPHSTTLALVPSSEVAIFLKLLGSSSFIYLVALGLPCWCTVFLLAVERLLFSCGVWAFYVAVASLVVERRLSDVQTSTVGAYRLGSCGLMGPRRTAGFSRCSRALTGSRAWVQ